ncbi:hypothetical protein [Streptomyces sp. DSM 40750]|uniref:hypothetical protein n=1 Tax=Streptomyces sp. DSM 40750 TaxID=2801030 RepID=UPI003FA6BCB3
MREEEIPRNVARHVRTGTPWPRRFKPLTATEARDLLAAASGHPLQPLLDLASGTAAIRRTRQVFTTAQGRPVDPTKLTRSFTTLLRKAGLRRRGAEGFRLQALT